MSASAKAHRDMENKVSHSSDELTRILATITIEEEESAGEGDALQADGRSACSCDLLAGQGQFQDDAGHLGDRELKTKGRPEHGLEDSDE